jgi:hypothetical protein
MRILSLFMVVGLVACASDGEVHTTPVFAPALDGDGDDDGHTSQGRTLLGALDDLPRSAGDHYSVSVNAFKQDGSSVTIHARRGALFAVENRIVHIGADNWFKNVRFHDLFGGQIEILSVVPATADEPVGYMLQYTPPDGAPRDPCDGEPADAISGRYTATRQHSFVSDALTFSCQSGVAYKCHRWGYKDPGDPADPMWGVNQACTRMANASYCGTGDVNTREGTYIGFYDFGPWGVAPPLPANLEPLHVHSWPPPHDQYYLEAAWRADGSVRCLSKARWASLPLEGPCLDGSLHDPRTRADASYCEELLDAEDRDKTDILIVSTSTYADLPLVTWATPNGDQLTTTRGYYDPRNQPRPGAVPAYPQSIPPIAGMQFVGLSGILLRNPTRKLEDEGVAMERVDTYCMPSDTQCAPSSGRCVATTATKRPATHTCDIGTEGYVFVEPRAHTVPLRMYHNDATDDFASL